MSNKEKSDIYDLCTEEVCSSDRTEQNNKDVLGLN
jgi:hypothetical protein